MSSAMCNLQYTIPLGLVGVQRGAEVALAVAGHNKDDQLAGILRAAADLQRSGGGGARADANHQALFSGQAAGHLEGTVVRALHDFVDDAGVQHIRHEARADALDLMWASLPAR